MIVLVMGASSSGKSKLAENIAVSLGASRVYIATMHRGGAELERRIARHREMRSGKGFATIEKTLDIGEIDIPSESVCLLECLSNLLANEMFDRIPSGDVCAKIENDIMCIAENAEHLVIVSNDVFSDSCDYDEFCMDYIAKLGTLNRKIALRADVVIESVAGLPFYHKGEKL